MITGNVMVSFVHSFVSDVLLILFGSWGARVRFILNDVSSGTRHLFFYVITKCSYIFCLFTNSILSFIILMKLSIATQFYKRYLEATSFYRESLEIRLTFTYMVSVITVGI